MQEEYALIRELIREEGSRKIFAQVFDTQTISTIHYLATKGHFEVLEFVISTGKEAHVFRAVDASGNFRAVKVYKIETSDFRRMEEYIQGDRRFKGIKKGKRELVFTWAKKEFRNLQEFKKAGIRVPMPIAQKNNVLVMEFIGKGGKAAKTLKENQPLETAEFRRVIADYIAKAYYKAKIVHADLSEYNILGNNGEFVVIDVGQAIPISHPKAKEFFERDLKNITRYLNKIGEKCDKSALLEEIKARKPKD